ncbi:MAG: ribosomal protein S18-alanine N-acetyltransferase [Dehalococcoidales bacterium]|nr:ribosomal protein S18-alanine N-acetyltransferase [Dehalococcoidales bacterium]
MPYYIRLMKMEDTALVSEIDREAFPTMKMPTNFENELNNCLAHYIVACDKKGSGNTNIIGVGGLWILVGEAHIVNIAVQPEYRRQGIGELLLISLIELALEFNCSLITLEVRASNNIAQNLYLKYGFTVRGFRRGYYTDNREDATVMTVDSINKALFSELYIRLKKEYYIKNGCSKIQLSTSL